ncbi:MAG TPA: cellulose binding domain-containing protein [Ktedonobacteraceae bacterium]|nr:cellulose binding domain-containing protein [Ktedonobacteraceae bacterium]
MLPLQTTSRKPQQFHRVAGTLGILALLLASLTLSLLTTHATTNAAGGLILEYADGTTSATTNTPRPHFEIANNTSSSVSLSNLTIRYWYTADGTQAQQFACDYALAGCSNVTASFVSLTSSTSTADTYLQVGFTSGAGSIAANGNSGEIQTRFNKSDWSNYNQANDYSWNQNQTSYAAWSLATLYLNGQLVWGTEPGGQTAPTPTPTFTPTSIPTATPTGTPIVGGSGGWTTSGTKILAPNGAQYLISGINWYGFETPDYVAHGLWSYDIPTILNLAKSYGYNTLRIPYSNQMWESNPIPQNDVGCTSCAGLHARDILAKVINYAGSIGLHVILDNHRSEAGESAEQSGLWYTSAYPESSWINDWISVQRWVHGIAQTQGAADTVTVNYLASDGLPIVLGYDLRNEPHVQGTFPNQYASGASWGSGDGINPVTNPNPNPFAPSCVSSSSCFDWRLAAERAGDSILADAVAHSWSNPLLFVEGVSAYPTASGTQAAGPYNGTWWGGELQGVNGNSNNAGAPVVFNAGGNASSLGTAVNNQIVYSAHEYGPTLFQQSWFNSSTCYKSGCSSSSLVDVWNSNWAYIASPNGVNPSWPGHSSYPWGNTGAAPYTSAPVWIGEFGTGNGGSDLVSSGAGSQGQWFTDLVNFIKSSYGSGGSGITVSNLNWTYWALNGEDSFALLNGAYSGLATPSKEYSYLCFMETGPLTVPQGNGAGQCGSTGALPAAQ